MKAKQILILITLWILLGSWGEKGHQKINSPSPSMFPSGLNRFKGWIEKLTEHGSDADNRKRTDPTEGIKHYIDIDIYDDFLDHRKICEVKEEAFNKYSKDSVLKYGTLPWVTDSVYNLLVKQFRSRQWSDAVLTAADLGHYVGDGHMPLHLTMNYDGQLSGQTGIHRRYESQMIGRYIDSVRFYSSRLHKVRDVNKYIFSYIYGNYGYKDSLLTADRIAFAKANHEYNETYYKTMWELTRGFTTRLIAESSVSVAELIRMAWIDAGRPRLPSVISFEKSAENKKAGSTGP